MYRQSRVNQGSWQQWVLGSVLACVGTMALAQTPETLPRADGSEITYYVKQADSQPAELLLVVMQGSDCNSVQNNPRIQDAFVPMLPSADVLTVEKYGLDTSVAWSTDEARSDCPLSTLLNDTLHQRVQDYSAVLEALQKQHEYKHVLVVGGSEGAVVAIMLAAESDLVDASIAFNGGGRWFKDDMIYSISAGFPEEEAASAAIGIEDFFAFLDNAPTEDAAIDMHGVRWWKIMKEHDQQATLLKVGSPLLLIQSGQDKSVNPIAVGQMMGEMNVAGKTNIHYRPYPALDHVFNDAEGQSHLDAVTQDMRAWLLEVVSSEKQ